MFGRKPRLAIGIIFQTEVNSAHSTHRQYSAALQNSTYKKEHDKEKKIQAGKCLDKLEQEGKVLVRNLTPRVGSGKLKPYWVPEIAEAVSRYKK